MRKGGQLVTEWHGRAIVIFREKIANRAGEKIWKTMKEMDERRKIQGASMIARSTKQSISKGPAQGLGGVSKRISLRHQEQ